MMKAIRNIDRVEVPPHGGLLPYLRTAIRNLIRDQVRNAGRHGERRLVEESIADPQASPLERALGSNLLDRYEAALEKLRPEEQHAIVLRVELDCGWGLIAKECGKPSAEAARVATTRALLRLAEEMSRAEPAA
jgi:RNA polymerase sigma factor (sigma-70 family)